ELQEWLARRVTASQNALPLERCSRTYSCTLPEPTHGALLRGDGAICPSPVSRRVRSRGGALWPRFRPSSVAYGRCGARGRASLRGRCAQSSACERRSAHRTLSAVGQCVAESA